MHTETNILLKDTELMDSHCRTYFADVRLKGNQIVEVGEIEPNYDEIVINARRSLLIPGLNDHHTHLLSYAASLDSVVCGPPSVSNQEQLIDALMSRPGNNWLRGVGFHESVTPKMDRAWLDAHGPNRPVRIQHRSGRLWILNSQGLDRIARQADSLSRQERLSLSNSDGRLYDVDKLVSKLTRAEPPPIKRASKVLASYGVTGLNDMTPSNDDKVLGWFKSLRDEGTIMQKVMLSGQLSLTMNDFDQSLMLGATKVHLHDNDLPVFDDFVELIRESEKQSRCIAVHCVTELALVFTLAALEAAEVGSGHRIEHASVIPPHLIGQLQTLQLSVVTQPNFVAEKGDNYRQEIPATEHPYLYRCKSLISAGIPLAFGTDLPFGKPDPWQAMQAAVDRRTPSGETFNQTERLTPEQALKGFIGNLESPFEPAVIRPGITADLCLLDVPWKQLRDDLDAKHVRMTIAEGKTIYSRD